MDKILTKHQVEAQLRQKSDDISRRLDALQSEVATTGDAVKEAVLKNPFVVAGGAVIAGLLVGLIFGGRRKGKQFSIGPSAHQALIDAYLDTLVDDARLAVATGMDPGDAVRAALQERIPLVVYTPEEPNSSIGVLGRTFNLALTTIAGFAVRSVMDYVASRLALEDVLKPFAYSSEAPVPEPPPETI